MTLDIRGVTVAFDGLVALEDVDLTLRQGEILGVIGPNGAGKTTLINAISGFVEPTGGSVFLDGADATNWAPHRRARAGVARSFQAARLFDDLTVLENVEAAALLALPRRADAGRHALSLLGRLGLESRAAFRAGALPGGDQQRLGVLRALALEPKFLLLDEPAAGLDEDESQELVQAIEQIRDDFGCGVLVVDHDMSVIMPLCDRIQVLNDGKTICVGDAKTVQASPAVIEAYLGSALGASVAHGN